MSTKEESHETQVFGAQIPGVRKEKTKGPPVLEKKTPFLGGVPKPQIRRGD